MIVYTRILTLCVSSTLTLCVCHIHISISHSLTHPPANPLTNSLSLILLSHLFSLCIYRIHILFSISQSFLSLTHSSVLCIFTLSHLLSISPFLKHSHSLITLLNFPLSLLVILSRKNNILTIFYRVCVRMCVFLQVLGK